MNNKFTDLLVLLAIVFISGTIGYTLHRTAVAVPTEQVAGSNYNANGFNPQYFYNGLYVSGGTTGGKYEKMFNSSSTPTTTLSSLTVTGHLTVGTGQTIQSASTTAITSKSDRVVVQLEQTSPIAGVTCNTNLTASATEATTIFASSSNTSLNGFTIQVNAAPVTNPFCFSYGITHGY